MFFVIRPSKESREVWATEKVTVQFGSLRLEQLCRKNECNQTIFSSCTFYLKKKNARARFWARAPLDPAQRSHRVYFSNVIHNLSIFHPNNLKFWEKLLLTYMNNFPVGSFLYVKLLQILFVGKVRKTRTTARYNLLLNIYKKSTT